MPKWAVAALRDRAAPRAADIRQMRFHREMVHLAAGTKLDRERIAVSVNHPRSNL